MTSQFQISLSGSDASYACDDGDTLLRAGLRHGLGLAYECNVGACGSCKFDLIEGEVDDLFPAAPGLRPKERERGKRLACQCVPRSDCTIKIRSGAEYASAVRPGRATARCTGRVAVTPDMSIFTFSTGRPAAFLAGQYAMLTVPGVGQNRAYSMSNLANPNGDWEFIIRRVPGGQVSSHLFDTLKPGDSIEIDGPYGVAYLRRDIPRRIVGIAGGSGLAPVMSIMKDSASLPTAGSTPVMLFGGRTPKDIPDVPKLLEGSAAAIEFYPVISAPEADGGADWSGDTGFVHEFIEHRLSTPLAECEYYLAGPPPMIESVVRLLVAEHKVPASQIHFDRFF